MSKRTKQDERDLQTARDNYYRCRRALVGIQITLTLHEAARGNNERPPKHVRGLAKRQP